MFLMYHTAKVGQDSSKRLQCDVRKKAKVKSVQKAVLKLLCHKNCTASIYIHTVYVVEKKCFWTPHAFKNLKVAREAIDTTVTSYLPMYRVYAA